MSSEIRPCVVVAACIVNSGHVLVTHRKSKLKRGEWELPGGRVNLGEVLEGALVREIREELGWDVIPTQLVHAQINTYDDDGEDYLVLYYKCLASYDFTTSIVPGRLNRSRWLLPGGTEHLFCLPGTREAMEKALQ